ncbi:hypothetical protein [Iningainema tapete]|uniref:Uncharacterized protein n=1 Tax=Iningainema tapete BLCC-T55 TaxID=2748662 RepID=A0A8J6XQP7_9CYAN|nr:hypothetical protein [Iningainema tapete]MBD2776494.1 hypothetical protein [Iningainema tapete BLCC-T55]
MIASLQIASLLLSSFIFGAIVCIIFNFRPIVEGVISHEQDESSIRVLEKLKLDTWIRYNTWGIGAAIAIIIIELIQVFSGVSVSLVTIGVSSALLGALLWNQVIDTKLLNLTDSVPTSAIVSDKGDQTWEFYHDQAPTLGVLLTLLSLTVIVLQVV